MTFLRVVILLSTAFFLVACEAADTDDSGDAIIQMSGDEEDGGAEDGEAATDASDDGGGDATSGPMADGGAPGELNRNSSCETLMENWPAEWTRFENEVLEIANEYRVQGYDCRTGGQFPAALPLTSNEALRCAARRHSLDMIERNFFDHVNPDGEAPDVRVGRTSYPARGVGENIAAGQARPRAVVEGWMNSDGHCANMMNGLFEELGTGYAKDETTRFNHFWTQVFGTQ